MGEGCEEQRAQHTAVWGFCVWDEGGGGVVANFDLLWSVCEDVFDP